MTKRGGNTVDQLERQFLDSDVDAELYANLVYAPVTVAPG
jgi:hypothetical protein